MIPIYAVVSFLSYLYYKKAIYFEVLRDCYEAFAIASFFTLMCHYIAPNLHDQKEYFRSVEPKNWVWPITWMQKCSGGQDKGWLRKPRSGLTWFNVRTHGPDSWAGWLTVIRLFGLASSNTASFALSSPSWPLSRRRKADIARARKTPAMPTSGSQASKPYLSPSPCTVSSNSTSN